jgi:DNA-binding response OmpR family regulator
MRENILVVDDTPAIVDALRMMLEIAGYVVATTSDSREVMRLLEEQRPDLLLLDIMMPGSNGKDLCQQIKQQEWLRHMPVLLISARRDVADIVVQAGADGSIPKPFKMKALLEVIDKALEKARKMSDQGL